MFEQRPPNLFFNSSRNGSLFGVDHINLRAQHADKKASSSSMFLTLRHLCNESAPLARDRPKTGPDINIQLIKYLYVAIRLLWQADWASENTRSWIRGCVFQSQAKLLKNPNLCTSVDRFPLSWGVDAMRCYSSSEPTSNIHQNQSPSELKKSNVHV